MALGMAIEHALPEFTHFEFRDRELMTECVAEDLDEIAEGGALRVAAEALYEDARKDGASDLAISASQTLRSAGSTASWGAGAMKIHAIRLENVRRFVDPVEIAGIGDGLNVLTAPNE